MQCRRSVKVFYVPGVISAIIIPLLLWHYGGQRIDRRVYTVIDLGLPAKPRPGSADVVPGTFEPFRSWDYRKIIVKPHTAKQNRNLYVSEVNNLQRRNEKETGIEFIMGDQNSYEDFITLLDVMSEAKQDTYGLDIDVTGHLFAVHIQKDPIEEDLGYVSICGGKDHMTYEKTDVLDGVRNLYGLLLNMPPKAYFIVFGYLLLLQISVLSLIRKSS